MNRSRHVGRWLGVAASVALLCLAAPRDARAQYGPDLDLATGTEWVASSDAEKTSYLIGISNLMSVEYAWQEHLDDPPSWRQTLIQDMWETLEHVTINQAKATIDRFYDENEDKRDLAVLDVLWVELVEPRLPEERK